jgi:hypothetical protein
MLNIIFKLQMLLAKKKQLHGLLLEREFISQTYDEYISDDETIYEKEVDEMRKEYRKKIEKKQTPNEGDNKTMMELDEKIKFIKYYKNLLVSSVKSEKEIRDFIQIIKSSL